MQIDTKKFGTIDVKENKIIEFKHKILGFEDYNKFTLIDNLEDDFFYWLQSTEEPELSFILLNPYEVIDDYEVQVSDDFLKDIKLKNDNSIIIYTMVNIGDNGEYIAINLKAPILINSENQLGGQVVLEKEYPTRHYIFKENVNN